MPPAEDEALSQAEAAYRQLRDKLIMLDIRPGRTHQ
jgi:DNA-binding GntR family transcriptional regulator